MNFWTIFLFVFAMLALANGDYSSSYEESEEAPKGKRNVQQGKKEASSYEESSE
jgi:hypothetical protein